MLHDQFITNLTSVPKNVEVPQTWHILWTRCVLNYSLYNSRSFFKLLVPLDSNRFHPILQWHRPLLGIWSYCGVLFIRNWYFQLEQVSSWISFCQILYLRLPFTVCCCISTIIHKLSRNVRVSEISSLRKSTKRTYPVFSLEISITIVVY